MITLTILVAIVVCVLAAILVLAVPILDVIVALIVGWAVIALLKFIFGGYELEIRKKDRR